MPKEAAPYDPFKEPYDPQNYVNSLPRVPKLYRRKDGGRFKRSPSAIFEENLYELSDKELEALQEDFKKSSGSYNRWELRVLWEVLRDRNIEQTYEKPPADKPKRCLHEGAFEIKGKIKCNKCGYHGPPPEGHMPRTKTGKQLMAQRRHCEKCGALFDTEDIPRTQCGLCDPNNGVYPSSSIQEHREKVEV